MEKGKGAFAGVELAGKTLGIVGLGAIGGLVANVATHLGMDVIGYDPYITVDAAWRLSRSVRHARSLDEIYEQADYITLHIPSLPTTRGMINIESLAKMKNGVRLINLARADLVNVPDIAAALESGKVASYVTDFPTEETVKVPGIINIPHLGASTGEAEDNCAVMAADELKDYIENGNIRNSVNFPNIDMPATGNRKVVVLHKNLPSLIAGITSVLSGRGINIENMTNKSRGDNACTLLEIADGKFAGLEDEISASISAIQGVLRVRFI